MNASKGSWIGAAIVVALGLGFALGRWAPTSEGRSEPATPGQSAALAAPEAAAPPSPSDPPAPSGPTAPNPSPESLLPERSPLAGDSVIGLMALEGDFAQTAALYALAGRADVAALKGYIDEALLIGIDQERSAALSILFLRFSELDPDESIEHLYRLDLAGRYNLLFMMFNGWAKYDLEAAMARLERLRGLADRQMASNAILEAHLGEDPATLQQLAARLPAGEANPVAHALRHRAERDPAGALKEALALSDASARLGAVNGIASAWARVDPKAALENADSIADSQLRKTFRSRVLSHLAQTDPDAALAMLSSTSFNERPMIINRAMSTLARIDPQRGLAAIAELESPQLRGQALGNLLASWASHDPRAAAAALGELSGLETRQHGYSIVSHYAQVAPLEALAWAEQIEGRKGQLWRGAIGAIAQRDPARAMAIVAALDPSRFRAEAMTSIIDSMAANDPLLAVEFLDEVPSGPSRHQAISNIASTWSQHDPVAAMDWVLTQPRAAQLAALPSLVYSVARHDPRLAAGYAELVPTAALENWVSIVVRNYAAHDPAEAARWIDQFRDLPQYGQWLGAVAAGYVAEDPRAGARLIARLTQPDHYRAAQIEFVQRWAGSDPTAVAKWWRRLPSERQDPALVQSLVSQWQQYDPEAAQRWVRRLADSGHRDAGIQALIGYGQMQPREAERWIRRLSSADLREQAYAQQAMQMARYDLDGARGFIRGAELTSEAQARLEQMLEQNSRLLH